MAAAAPVLPRQRRPAASSVPATGHPPRGSPPLVCPRRPAPPGTHVCRHHLTKTGTLEAFVDRFLQLLSATSVAGPTQACICPKIGISVDLGTVMELS